MHSIPAKLSVESVVLPTLSNLYHSLRSPSELLDRRKGYREPIRKSWPEPDFGIGEHFILADDSRHSHSFQLTKLCIFLCTYWAFGSFCLEKCADVFRSSLFKFFFHGPSCQYDRRKGARKIFADGSAPVFGN